MCFDVCFAFGPSILVGVLGSVSIAVSSACTLLFLARVGSVFWLLPANPGRALWCVRFGKAFGSVPPTLAGVCGACVKACVLDAPCQS